MNQEIEADRTGARRLWQHIEPVHAVVYFAPEIAEGFAATGLRGWWSGYFAARAAPLGECSPELVEATFFGFAPSRVRKAIPYAWRVVRPADAVRLRERCVSSALARLLGPALHPDDLARLLELLQIAVDGAELPGRALFAANRALELPEDPLAQLWHDCTLLREHRGDGHNAALVASRSDGAQANRLAAGAGVLRSGDDQRVTRGWSEQEWADATSELEARGWMDSAGRLTPVGLEVRRHLEEQTDDAASGPVRALGPDRLAELLQLLEPLVAALVASGTISYPNPIGLTQPD